MRSGRTARGFTLLEAIVALAILAAAGLALFAGMAESRKMLQRADRVVAIDAATANALAYVERLNPMDRPRGELALGEYEMRWTSEPLEPPRPSATGYLQPGLYDVGLYRVRVELRKGGVLEQQIDIRRVGYRQVRKPAAV